MVNSTLEQPDKGANEEFDKSHVIGDVYEDFLLLLNLQHGTFLTYVLAMEQDSISH